MENQDMISSPRKRLKMDTDTMDRDQNPQRSTEFTPSDKENLSSLAKASMDFHSLQTHKEEDVGITEFISPDLPGFTGILKKRYTDFLVNEILSSGAVVHLDNLKATNPPGSEEPVSEVKTELPESANLDASTNGAVSESAETSADQTITNYVKNGRATEKVENVNPNEGVMEEVSKHEVPKQEVPKQEVPMQEVSKQEVPKQEVPKQEVPKQEMAEMKGSKTVPLSSESTSLELPTGVVSDNKTVAPAITSVAQWQSYAGEPKGFQLTPADEAIMKSFFEHDVVQEILALFNRVLNSPHRKPKDYGIVKSSPITDRELRKTIHQELRRIFSSRLESFTDDGALLISVAPEKSVWGSGGRGGRGVSSTGRQNNWGRQSQGNVRLGWRELGGDYLHFTLYKENKDTMEVIAFLARQLQTKPQSFQFAGTKDRRAVTAQRISAYHVRADRMVQVGRTLRQAKIGNYEYQPCGLELGESNGNEFVITLRDCQFPSIASGNDKDRITAASAIVDAAAKHFSDKGYLNYFGLQRFGTFSTRTDTIGKLMLQGNFQGAVSAILSFSPESLAAAQGPSLSTDTISSEDKARAWAINSFNLSGKSHSALDSLPRKFSAEFNLIRYLGVKDRSHDYLGAMQSIPRNLRLMYVHAYQSLIWNLAASHHWKHSGFEVMVGDLVLIDEHKEKNMVIKPEEPEHIDADGEVIIKPAAEDSARSADERFVRARALSQEDVASGTYSIYDVVLPTPGFDVLYPDNEVMKSFYKDTMASEVGGGLDPYDMRRSWKDVSLSGSYRKLLAKPSKEITFEVRAYTRDDEQFVETDMDRINKQRGEQSDSGGNAQEYTLGERHMNGHGTRGMKDGEAVDRGGAKPDPTSAAVKTKSASTTDDIKVEDGKEVQSDPLSAAIKTEPTSDTNHTNVEEGEAVMSDVAPAPIKVEPVSDDTHMKMEEGDEVAADEAPAKLAVILKLQLGSSQYATMALRELMKLGGVRTYKPDFGGGR
ncbi:hypothetical protein MMC26_002498 [Xylographa opegraphella]|nr:hypothetical protein [Xylographa opegraphella]